MNVSADLPGNPRSSGLLRHYVRPGAVRDGLRIYAISAPFSVFRRLLHKQRTLEHYLTGFYYPET